ncbi:MAG TPA: NADP-dependent malic enzyme [Candidatus Cloacimonas sp.]|jgi:malate dehydrogenase (oxaloacetate-decarboxylating)|nr:NADP-dependent malic enzyme [Candidatus Cloacimonas sp.]MDD3734271.1 NADP-dependent malic enzyme [Candidatus Cloacimonadota bacterium]HOQ77825.1 NADP-dependent malic enzyme [Candidatus Cloacimonas sp.]HPH71620.1 NADP-dependent malic enzyme [Candidatus Cloacimonas sp.]HPK60272.1 NADP-dependent malic enzyme [Candidatus Cloacimonas sp.]
MNELNANLSNLAEVFSELFAPENQSAAQTYFLKELSLKMHSFYQGKMQTLPKAGIWGFNWFNVWYTPGVSSVSTTIRDNPLKSYELSNRGNLVAVVSDSTRVLGDGDCGIYGGLGVMEGKAMLMKYLGACDAISLCIDSRNEEGKPQAQKIIDFVKMLQPSVGAVNLEDISQPNCYLVLDELRQSCSIPVWHDDAQGTACVTLAGLLNALKLADKDIKKIKCVLFGAGASNTTIASFLMQSGLNPEKLIMFDSKGSLHPKRYDLRDNPAKFKQWKIAQISNPDCQDGIENALTDADVLIALSTPGPDTIKPQWISKMAKKAIVFTCANPVPEIYPYDAKQAGAFIAATGRGDFPNQINNSLGFPGILKGALTVQASKITDNMAIKAAHSLANFAEKKGINPEYIIPQMDEEDVFAYVSADVATQAIIDNVARKELSWNEVFNIVQREIRETRSLCLEMMNSGYLKPPDKAIIDGTLQETIMRFGN